MSKQFVSTIVRRCVIASAVAAAWCVTPMAAQAGRAEYPVLPGAIYSTDYYCIKNINEFEKKDDVYVNGGAGPDDKYGLVPNAYYYVMVTDPSGKTVLGSSNYNTDYKAPIKTNPDGKFDKCYKVAEVVSLPDGTKGYADTPNPGGEYKVWISLSPSFYHRSTKTDNYKVKYAPPPPPPVAKGDITIKKWYDRNTNGKWDFGEGEVELPKWKVDLLGYEPAYTPAYYADLPLGEYTAREYKPDQKNWYPTNAYIGYGDYYPPYETTIDPSRGYLNKISVKLTKEYPKATVYFGNVCTGPGGAKDGYYWSSKYGKYEMEKYGLENLLYGLKALYLVDRYGRPFDPTSYKDFWIWLRGAYYSTNTDYKLSVELAILWLNFKTNHVSGTALVYAPGSKNANAAGFITVTALIDEINYLLGKSGYPYHDDPYADYKKYLLKALYYVNHDKGYAQYKPCEYSFYHSYKPY